MQQELTFTQNYRIRSYETDFAWRATITALCNHLQDIASLHADTMGFGYEDLVSSGRAWVLARAYLRMDRLPRFGQTAEVTTWPSANLNTVATRDFVISEGGSIAGKGTSAWAVIDMNTRKAVPADDFIDLRKIPQQERAIDFETRAVKRIREGERSVTVVARQSDQDINRHVNSIRQVEFLLESTPESWHETRACMGADVQFRAECHAGETIVSICSPNDDNTAQHILMRVSDNKEIARMKSWWE